MEFKSETVLTVEWKCGGVGVREYDGDVCSGGGGGAGKWEPDTAPGYGNMEWR